MSTSTRRIKKSSVETQTPIVRFEELVEKAKDPVTSEEKLTSLEYRIEKRILRRENDVLFVSHLLLTDRFGNYLFVHLNINEGIHFDPSADKYHHKIDGQLIPSEMIIPRMECVGEICDVGFICKGSYCFSRKIETGLHFDNIVITDDGSKEYIYIGDAAISYPLFEVTEVISRPILVQSDTEKAIQKLDRESYSITVKEFDDFKDKVVSEFTSSYARFVEQIVVFNQKSALAGTEFDKKITSILTSEEPEKAIITFSEKRKTHNDNRAKLLTIIQQTQKEFEKIKHFVTFLNAKADEISQMKITSIEKND